MQGHAHLRRGSVQTPTLNTINPVFMRHRSQSAAEPVHLDPESDPLVGTTFVVPKQAKAQKVAKSIKSSRSGSSVYSMGSKKSGLELVFATTDLVPTHRRLRKTLGIEQNITAYIDSCDLFCYTCGGQLVGINCKGCQTMYLPPDLRSDTFVSPLWLLEEPDARPTVDFDLLQVTAANGDVPVLEAMSFGYFSNIDTISNTFYNDDNPFFIDVLKIQNLYEILACSTASPEPPGPAISAAHAEPAATPRPAGSAKTGPVMRPADRKQLHQSHPIGAPLCQQQTCTGPMRGVLQAAQCVLQTRKHKPITDKELVYIFVVLQCPALSECSMFTKISGPSQKLERYSGLRSRARTLLEVCSGLVANMSNKLYPVFLNFLQMMPTEANVKLVQLCNSYISHRLYFIFESRYGFQSSIKNRGLRIMHDWYKEDWRIASIVKMLSFLWSTYYGQPDMSPMTLYQLFYNTMTDVIELNEDYEQWQRGNNKQFCFCRFPFLLSVGSKARIMEYAVQQEVSDVVRRELLNAGDRLNTQSLEQHRAFISSVSTFSMEIRRTHLLEDSLEKLNDWSQHKKKSLRIRFAGEPGVDAGGLRKEWFALFYKQLFEPELQVFVMDETSNFCWFGQQENMDYYRTAGVVLGLAFVNSITVDLNLPLLLFKLLLDQDYTLDDVSTLWPEIGQSLQIILDYSQPDFEEAFGLMFVGHDGRELVPNGQSIPVTSANKHEFVELTVKHMVDSDSERIRWFKHAFLQVCGNNALALLEPEELELLVLGDRKPIDVKALRAVTRYVNFGLSHDRADQIPIVQQFWEVFEEFSPEEQANLLQFVTSTDRVPATGIMRMNFKIKLLGDDTNRLPIAHTCFNQLGLYRYRTKAKLKLKLKLAISEFQGFGLK